MIDSAYITSPLALQVKPFDLATPLEAGAQIRSRQLANDETAQMTPLRVAQQQQAVQAGNISLGEAQQGATLRDAAFQNSLIAQAASLTDPNDPDASSKWDEAMKAAQDKGAAGAGQFIGRYNPALRERVTAGYGAPSPLAAASAMGTGGMPSAQPVDSAKLDLMFRDQTPAQMQATYQKLDTIKQALIHVSNSANPAAAWDEAAAAIGHPEYRGQYSPMRLQALWQETVPVEDYLQSRAVQQGAGVPAPVIPPVLKEAAGALYNVDPKSGKVTLAAGGKWSLVGTDPDTKEGIYVNTDTGVERKGDMPLAPKPGVQSNRLSVFQLKQKAYLETHPDDTQGALDYANGRKNMTPEQMQEFAIAQANRDYQAAILGGESIPDQGGYVAQRTNAIVGQLQAAAGGAPGGGGGAGGAADQAVIPPRAVALLKEGVPHTFNNNQVWTLRNGKPVRLK